MIEVGRQVTQFKVGDIVFSGRNQGHVQYHLLRESDLVTKLPRRIDLQSAALMGVAGVSYHDALRARIKVGDNVLVFGAGLIGQFAAQVARILGGQVTVADRHEDRLTLAMQLGATRIIDMRDAQTGWQDIETLKPFDVILECSGGDVLDRMIGRKGKHAGFFAHRGRGRLVMVAGRFDVSYDFRSAGAAELDILHTQHFDQHDLVDLVDHVSAGRMQIRPLIRDVVRLEDAVKVYDTLRDDKNRLLGMVFMHADEPSGCTIPFVMLVNWLDPASDLLDNCIIAYTPIFPPDIRGDFIAYLPLVNDCDVVLSFRFSRL